MLSIPVRLHYVFVCLAMCLLSGCSGLVSAHKAVAPEAGNLGGVQATYHSGDDIPDVTDSLTDEPARAELTTDADQPSDPRPASDRMRVHNAAFRLITADLDSSTEALARTVEEVNGFVESRTNATVVCRVPADRFSSFITGLDEFGDVSSREISTVDVTDEYRDLDIRLQVLEASLQRVIGLMDKADAVDDILKLEEQLARITTEIETIKGRQRSISRTVAYSTINVEFVLRSVSQVHTGSGRRSPFPWINELGPHFGEAPAVAGSVTGPLEPVWEFVRGRPPLDTPDGFMTIADSRHELWAIAADNAAVHYREFDVPGDSDLKFWSRAVSTHLVDHRGFRLLDEADVERGAGLTIDRVGRQLLFETSTSEGPVRYLVTLSLAPARFLRRGRRVQVMEFSAPARQFAEYQEAVASVMRFPVAIQADKDEAGRLMSQVADPPQWDQLPIEQ